MKRAASSPQCQAASEVSRQPCATAATRVSMPIQSPFISVATGYTVGARRRVRSAGAFRDHRQIFVRARWRRAASTQGVRDLRPSLLGGLTIAIALAADL